ncbi:hypothetical protein I553_0964 [Mycobacterium xenopi 4042]|uniref:Uncharacterized protein n=1 Tax=Mycobacterium xenopi 4042 TaxID=1299334 RepID=X7Z9E8_MYCXE|nr:hypothetical protein I553_0964 [Mycobacterium xenopi 4042]
MTRLVPRRLVDQCPVSRFYPAPLVRAEATTASENPALTAA